LTITLTPAPPALSRSASSVRTRRERGKEIDLKVEHSPVRAVLFKEQMQSIVAVVEEDETQICGKR